MIYINFFIGFFASVCAVFIPRMAAMLTGGHIDVQYWNIEYISVGLMFSLVIGGVTTIFVQGTQKTAAEIFMTALGIPAVLAGALNSGVAGNNLGELHSVNQKLTEMLAQKSSVPIEKGATNIAPLKPLSANSNQSISISSFSFISNAQAGVTQPAVDEGLKLGINVEQTPHLIVLKKNNTKEEALRSAEELRRTFPDAMVVQSNQNFYVIDGNKPLSKSAALLKAINLQSKTDLKPSLLQLQ